MLCILSPMVDNSTNILSEIQFDIESVEMKPLAFDKLNHTCRAETLDFIEYGPCTINVAQQDWLCCAHGNPNDPFQLCLYKNF